MEWLRHAFQQHCQVWWRSFQRWRPHVVVKYTGRAPFLLFYCFYIPWTRLAYTHKPILKHNSSNDADWLEEVLFKQVFFDIFTFWGSFSPKTPNSSLPIGKSHAKRNCRITSNPFELGQKLQLTTDRKSWSLFQNQSWKIVWNAP